MMKKPTIYVFSGYSGAGKDTAAAAVTATNIKFAAPGKRALEFMLGIPGGSLDNREFRQQVAPHCQGRTYLQVLIDFYHHRNAVIGADLFPEQMRQKIQTALDLGNNVSITDLRSAKEREVILDFWYDYHPVIPVWIEGGTELSSDSLQVNLHSSLCRFIGIPKGLRITIDNTKRLPDFQDKVRKILDFTGEV